MALLKNHIFICVDCEATGLDTKNDRIVEIAIAKFTLDTILEEFETLIDPEMAIPATSMQVHHITNEMVQGKPKIDEILPHVIKMIGSSPIVGHGVAFDVDIISQSASRHQIFHSLNTNLSIDTVRLARLYGESPSNSLESLRHHFHIEEEGAHRAMSDVIVNIQVFKRLTHGFTTVADLKEALNKPIFMRNMPLGKHKGRPLRDLPLDYILWAARQEFDQDLLYSLRSEVNRRKKGNSFSQSTNPFQALQ